MAEPAAPPTSTDGPPHGSRGRSPAPPLTPGKVAIWLFLGTEVMFFTGLIGSYIVFRAGSPAGAYSNLFAPGTDLTHARQDARGLVVDDPGANPHQIAEIVSRATGLPEHDAEHQLELLPTVFAVSSSYQPADVDGLLSQLKGAGASAQIVGLEPAQWPRPYNILENPLSIDLTAINTFILICSSVTMVLALAAIQRGDKKMLSRWLLATVLIGTTFVSIQVFEYYQLMFGHRYSAGVSATGHFRPDSSLFASCFFTMTGFHGAHVTAGVITLAILWLRSLFGGYTDTHHAPVEMAGIYWHFVDLVWILLFTIVYLF